MTSMVPIMPTIIVAVVTRDDVEEIGEDDVLVPMSDDVRFFIARCVECCFSRFHNNRVSTTFVGLLKPFCVLVQNVGHATVNFAPCRVSINRWF